MNRTFTKGRISGALLFALAACSSGGQDPSQVGLADAALTPAPFNRVDVLIDDAWKFIEMDVPAASAPGFDDSSWAPVSLPHTWNVSDGQTPNYYRGPGWYRRHYNLPTAYAGKKLYLQFDAASKVADVFVNGSHVGQHRGGNAIFRFDVTSLLEAGTDNVIAVKVDNSAFPDVPPLSGDFTQFGGLYRNAHLLVTDSVHVDVLDHASPGVFITPAKVSASSADLAIRVELVNDDKASHTVDVEADVLDASHQVVKTLTATQTLTPTAAGTNVPVTLSSAVASPHLWNGRVDPYLYTVQISVKEAGVLRDALSQPLGFRSYVIDPDKGFLLNGQYLDLHGVNRHQEREGLGWALTTKEHDEDMALIKEMGATVIRLCHYQHDQYFHDLADQNGMLLWAEVGIVNAVTQSTAFDQNAAQQLTELIRQSYNHPSIVLWSLSNELSGGLPLMTTLDDQAHKEDPSRSTTLADNANATSKTGSWDARSQISDTVGFNHYSGWYGSGVPGDVASYLDSLHQQKPAKTFGISEYGAGASIKFHSATPAIRDHTEEYQNFFHETYWAAFKTRPFVWGKMIWNMFDFASANRNEGDTPGINDKGLMTHDHQTKKDAFYFYKASWTSEPFVYITSRRFEPRTAATTDIKVYANTDSVELTLNGASLGSKTSADHVFVWPGVTLIKGRNTVSATGTKAGISNYEDSVTWTLD